MSWDIFIQDLPEVSSMKEVPEGFAPGPIGLRDELVARVMEAVPFAVVQDGSWLFLTAPDIDISIQLHMEDAERVRYMAVHVHGGEQSAVCVSAILGKLKLRAIDTATSEFFDRASLEEGL